jgi:hypothetical protein
VIAAFAGWGVLSGAARGSYSSRSKIFVTVSQCVV